MPNERRSENFLLMFHHPDPPFPLLSYRLKIHSFQPKHNQVICIWKCYLHFGKGTLGWKRIPSLGFKKSWMQRCYKSFSWNGDKKNFIFHPKKDSYYNALYYWVLKINSDHFTNQYIKRDSPVKCNRVKFAWRYLIMLRLKEVVKHQIFNRT